MSFQAKRELLVQVAPRYRAATGAQKQHILDEFVAATGYARKYAIRVLGQPALPATGPIVRPRAPHYGPAVVAALERAWAAANFVCAKRLVPFLPELVVSLERHGHLALPNDVRAQLLALSPATADRILRRVRAADRPHGIGTTKAGTLLKHRVPIRTFAEWDDVRPGFMEADLVAHCGTRAEGAYLYTLTLTDVATGWTACLALPYRSPEAVIQALDHARRLLPFPLRGLDTDNGGEFLNNHLLAYCTRDAITFTRGRAYRKNDQCYVEQKNGSVVRQLVGYDRFAGERAYRQLAEVYRAVRLYVNFFQPSLKLQLKRRDGSHVYRRYDAAQTPLQRLLAAGVLDDTSRVRLRTLYETLDPVRLLRQLQTLQDALWRHAVVTTPPLLTGPMERFSAGACGLAHDTGVESETLSRLTRTSHKRAYRRAAKAAGPRTYRTREDPFAGAWEEIHGWLAVEPERTAKSIFLEVQRRDPARHPDGQLRTLQRRIGEWRAQAILAFDDGWLDEDTALGQRGPEPLQLRIDTIVATTAG